MKKTEPIAILEHVTKRYTSGDAEVLALNDVSLELHAGEMVALVGPSGCGKSTTLNVMSGVDRPDSGSAVICGIDLKNAGEAELTRYRRQHVGIVFQAFHLMPHLTVEENVALPLSLAGRKDPARVRSLLERVGLGHRLRHYPSQLSGGEQQRAAVARALAHRPDLVLADEPTGNLDSRSGVNVLALLDELRRESGAAMLMATHDPELVKVADRVIHMRDSRIESTASPTP